MASKLICLSCLEEFEAEDVVYEDDPDGYCPRCHAPGPFMEEDNGD